jgi:hypothetical protein
MSTKTAARTIRKTLSLGFIVAAPLLMLASSNSVFAQETYTPEFTSDKMLKLPTGKLWREWTFIGSLVTPNALNDGSAPFPEHHMVYVEPKTWEHYKKTGKFREGAVLAKELARVLAPDGANKDGSTTEVSGTGYFSGEFSGFEITIKSKELYPNEPGNWAYYTFGHQPEPYNSTAERQPAEACNACHESVAAEDFVFSQFYPVLKAAKPK